MSTSDNIAHKGVLLVAVGMRYKGYCANVGRSFIVDPTRACCILSVIIWVTLSL
jgi:nucleosome binding factor SPN SPT16 subunit